MLRNPVAWSRSLEAVRADALGIWCQRQKHQTMEVSMVRAGERPRRFRCAPGGNSSSILKRLMYIVS